MADNVTNVILAGIDRTAGMFSSFQRGLSEAESASAGLKKTLGTLGVGFSVAGILTGIVSIGKASLKAAEESEIASARLTAVLKATGGAAGITKKELDDLADSMAKSTQFDDESIRRAEAELLKYRNIQGDTFREAMNIAADYAAFSGKGIAESAEAIGKGLSKADAASKLLKGTVGELTKSEQDAVEKMLELGNAAGAQQVILEKLNSSFAGTADEMNKGLNKATKDLDKSWDELLETMGKTGPTSVVVNSGMASMAGVLTSIKTAIEEADAKARNSILFKATGVMTPLEEKDTGKFPLANLSIDGLAAANAAIEQKRKQTESAANALAEKEREVSKKASAASAKSAAADYDRITLSIAKLTAEISAEDAALSPLLKTEKLALDLMVDIGSGKTKLTIAQKISTVAALEEAIAKDKLAAATKKSANERALEQKALADENESRWKNIDALDTEIKSLESSGEEIGLSVEGLNALKLARMDAAIATKEHTLAVEEATTKGGSNVEALKIEIEQLKKIRDLTASNQGKQAVADIAKANLDTQVEMWQSIDKTAHDTWVSIANGGKDTWTRLKETGKNIFFDWLYSMARKKWMVNIATSVSGTGVATQAFGAANVAGTGSSALSMASNASSIYGAFSGGYSAVAADAIWSETAVAGLGEVMQGSVMAGIESGLAAIPVWGWAALAAIAVFSLSSKGGGPKTGGDAFGQITGNDFAGIGNIPGQTGVGYYTPNGSDAQVKDLISPLGEAIALTIKGFGGTSGGTSFGLGFDTDPNGTAGSRVTSGVYDKNGKVVYQRSRDVGRDADMAKEMGNEANVLMLAMIKSADQLPSIVTAIAGSIDLMTVSADKAAAAIAHITDASAVWAYTVADPVKAVMDQMALDATGMTGAMQRSSDALNTLITAYDGSAASTKSLAASTQAQYQLELQLIGQIQSALSSTQGMFGGSIESIKLSVMDDPAKYDYLRTQADSLYSQLAGATDPAQIQSLADKINTDINAAWSLVEADKKTGASGEFIDYLTKVDTLTTDRLTQQQDQVAQNHKDLTAAIETAMDKAAAKFMEAAANTPSPAQAMRVDFHADIPGDVEVSLG